MVDIATSEMVSMLNNSQMGLGGGQVATSTPSTAYICCPHIQTYGMFCRLFSVLLPPFKSDRLREWEPNQEFCLHLCRNCDAVSCGRPVFIGSYPTEWGQKSVWQKFRRAVQDLLWTREGRTQNLSGRWAVNNNSAQQQERYAEAE